jgi:hypothetical protein
MNENNLNNEEVFVVDRPVVIDLVGGPVVGICTICIERVRLWGDPPDQGEVAVEPNIGCGHVFHHKCFQHWLDMGGTVCPNCHATVTHCIVRLE